MPKILSSSLFALGLVGGVFVGCAGEPSSRQSSDAARSTDPIPPYSVRVEGLDESSGARLVTALAAIEGVGGAELDLETSAVSVQTKAGAYLYEPQVRAAVASAEVQLAAFEAPSEALVTVYVVEVEGGG